MFTWKFNFIQDFNGHIEIFFARLSDQYEGRNIKRILSTTFYKYDIRDRIQ